MDDTALRDSCTRFLNWHGLQPPEAVLRRLLELEALRGDQYGVGGVVTQLEQEVGELLGKPAAFFLSGTMAQQIALRVHADRRGRRTVAYHPTAHPELHEGKALERLHGLRGRPVGERHELLTLQGLEQVAEPLAAVLFELPQREIGGQLPAWHDLQAQTAWAREHGAATHLDGARLWECTPYYGRPPAEIAGLFDTVYASLYKGVGGLSGCCLAGPEDVLAEAREWRQRHGGTLFAMWPNAASALLGLRERLPRMPLYVEHAQVIAAALTGLPGVEVVPDPPVTPMMHLHLRTSKEAFEAARDGLARERGVWAFPRSSPSGSPGVRVVELMVGDSTLQFFPAEVRELVATLVGATRG
ncbi:threonine aldolase family protein [Motilibacter aurantiacus]|uniref:threonine aldolase family protein n=1 Tax=Motilibacter aurantiacus TaxID=2714955 RepID=UPI001408CB46|nr:beta-eliminating lyase-related protein [Motilibacter aurantiacus]NHC47553.1 threonine aldolase [Motilibacter aurantiacus]